MGIGYLKVNLFAGRHALPMVNSRVLIKNTDGKILYDLITDENGTTETVSLSAPDKKYSQSPFINMPKFSVVDIEIPALEGHKKAIVHWAEVFDTITSIASIQLHPQIPGESAQHDIDEYYIPIEHAVDMPRYSKIDSKNHKENANKIFSAQNAQTRQVAMALANDVPIPEYITVHLGAPNEYARNITIPFVDYIKNVACSEIYPTWHESALYANIYAQISFALNRMFTLWYKSRGFAFDITSLPAFDQAFIEGRCIFDNINLIVNEIFNQFLRRENRLEPFFASYCNGTTSICEGMSQWGSQLMAEEGYTPIQILRYYYFQDIQIVESNNFGEQLALFPGTPLREGDSGEDVRLMQLFLNRIYANFSAIPVMIPNGIFGSETTESVKTFQNAFNLIENGIIGKDTWYEIVRIYVAVTDLASLNSLGIRISAGEIPPNVTIQVGLSGELVSKLQFLLDYISEFYPIIPTIMRTSRFSYNTETAVIEFQKNFGLVANGIVDATTWQKLYSVYFAIVSTFE